jgi:hypothetical protein
MGGLTLVVMWPMDMFARCQITVAVVSFTIFVSRGFHMPKVAPK